MPESQNTEWKSRWKDEYLEWICGYANAQGGKLYIGCDDEGNVVGLPNARKLLEDIPTQPEYTINPGDIMIKFTAPEDRVIWVTERVTVRVTDEVTDKEQTVLTLLAEDPGYTMPQLAERLGVSRKTVAARLKKLKEAGLIERIGSDRKGYWKLHK